MSLSPGLHWTQPGNGDWESPLVPVTCVGTVEGRQIESTPGELRFSGTYEDATCALASGEGTLTVTLLTTDGPMTLSGTIRWTAEGPLARAQGRIGSSPFKAVGHFRPDLEHPDEDCYNRPLRHVILRGFGILGA